MNKYWTLNGKQLLVVILYTAIFPIANLIQGKIGEVPLFLNAPFLPLAWIGGMSMTFAFSAKDPYINSAYVMGASATIFLQVWLCAVISFNRKKKNKSDEPI